MRTLVLFSLFLLAIAADDDRTRSPFFWVQNVSDPTIDCFPLNATWIHVDIDGVIANVKVTQLYQNRGTLPLDAMYVFPASTRASIRGMQMHVNDRLIVAELHDKDEARTLYAQAKDAGKTASLLEMERPNVLNMNVGNILPDDVVRVEIFYTELLQVEAGVYSFMYPATVMPRYGAADMTPVVSRGDAPLFDYGLEGVIHAGMPISVLRSPTHALHMGGNLSDGVATMRFKERTAGAGTKDLLIEYSLAGKAPAVGTLFYDASADDGVGGPFRVHKQADNSTTLEWDRPQENFFLTMVQPPAPGFEGEPAPREFLFILDVSGSMEGFSHDTSVKLLHRIIGQLRPTDYFNMVAFEFGDKTFKPFSVPANTATIKEALHAIKYEWGTGGGTNLLGALKNALALPRALPHVARTVVILTDGGIVVEADVFRLVQASIDKNNFFCFSIGWSPNRYLTEGIAIVGRGLEMWVHPDGDVESIAAKFMRFALHPVLTDIRVTLAPDFDASELLPVPAILLTERPLVICGKYAGALPKPGTRLLTVTGVDAQGNAWSADVLAPAEGGGAAASRALPYLWAQAKIEDYRFTADNSKERIMSLALKYNLLTEYTSFLAVDTHVRFDRNEAGSVPLVVQAIPLPMGFGEGDSFEDIGMNTQMSGTLPHGNGGTGYSSYATGYILYASGVHVPVSYGRTNQVINVGVNPETWDGEDLLLLDDDPTGAVPILDEARCPICECTKCTNVYDDIDHPTPPSTLGDANVECSPCICDVLFDCVLDRTLLSSLFPYKCRICTRE